MRFQFGHPLMSRMQEYLASNFDGNVWGANGPLAITQILYDTCKVSFTSLIKIKKRLTRSNIIQIKATYVHLII